MPGDQNVSITILLLRANSGGKCVPVKPGGAGSTDTLVDIQGISPEHILLRGFYPES